MILDQYKEKAISSATYLNSQETKLFRKGSTVYSTGDKVDFIYVILNGEIESIVKKQKTLRHNIIIKKGGSLGLMDLMLDRDHSKTMLAKKTSVLALIKKEHFLNFLKPYKYEAILLKSLAIDIDNQNKNLWS